MPFEWTADGDVPNSLVTEDDQVLLSEDGQDFVEE